MVDKYVGPERRRIPGNGLQATVRELARLATEQEARGRELIQLRTDVMHEITALRNEYYSWREIQIEKVTAIQGKLDHLPAQLETLATKIALKTSEQLSRRPTWLYAGIVAALLALSSSLIVALVTTGGRSL